MNEGWEDDDDLDLDTTWNNTSTEAVGNETSVWEDDQGFFGQTPQKPVASPPKASEGWEEDDDLVFDDETAQQETSGFGQDQSGMLSTEPAIGEGWEPDISDDALDITTTEQHETQHPAEVLFQDLQEYVNALSLMQSSINAVLEYEYNTLEKAHELVEYYASRPGLAEYTRTKEVPRMNYQVVLPNGKVETSKEVIAEHHLPDDSLISRCANQSLLADMLHVLTGADLVVRPQFLAICVAQTCLFRIHMGDNRRDMVQCSTMLKLSLPVSSGPRLDIATIRATIVFSPQQPMVKFNVDKVIVMLKDMSKLHPVVDFLLEAQGHMQDFPGHSDLSLQHAPADQFRDAFLQDSLLWKQGTAGMKNAINDMESVLGLRSKIKAVKGGISKFLPDTDAVLAAEEEARAMAHDRETVRGPPPPGNQIPQNPPNMERPKSILGGLVSSGWKALAKSVEIPDEPIPNDLPHQPAMSLYRREEVPSQPIRGPPPPPPPVPQTRLEEEQHHYDVPSPMDHHQAVPPLPGAHSWGQRQAPPHSNRVPHPPPVRPSESQQGFVTGGNGFSSMEAPVVAGNDVPEEDAANAGQAEAGDSVGDGWNDDINVSDEDETEPLEQAPLPSGSADNFGYGWNDNNETSEMGERIETEQEPTETVGGMENGWGDDNDALEVSEEGDSDAVPAETAEIFGYGWDDDTAVSEEKEQAREVAPNETVESFGYGWNDDTAVPEVNGEAQEEEEEPSEVAESFGNVWNNESDVLESSEQGRLEATHRDPVEGFGMGHENNVEIEEAAPTESAESFGYGWGDDDVDIDDEPSIVLPDEPDSKREMDASVQIESVAPTAHSSQPVGTAPPVGNGAQAEPNYATSRHVTHSSNAVSEPPTASSPLRLQSTPQLVPLPSRELIAAIPYDPTDDIIPTRKRWTNPRPHRSYILG